MASGSSGALRSLRKSFRTSPAQLLFLGVGSSADVFRKCFAGMCLTDRRIEFREWTFIKRVLKNVNALIVVDRRVNNIAAGYVC